MPIFRSTHPPIDLPKDLAVWDWAFDSDYSPLRKYSDSELAGYQNAITKERVNWRHVKEFSTYISTALVKKYGLKEGQKISLFSLNTIWYPVAMFGAVRVGAVISGASPAYNVEEMTYALKTAQARFIMTSPPSIEVAAAAAANAGIPKEHIFLLEGEVDGYPTLQDLVRIGKEYGEAGQIPAFKIPEGRTNFDVCGFLSFSSGTTGLPKAVMIAHSNVIAQCLQLQQLTAPTHKKVLSIVPLFHISGLVHNLHLPIAINAENVMLPSFTMESMLNAIVEYRIKELLLVPPIIIRLVRDPIVAKYDLSQVERFSSGAAPLSAGILQLLEKKFPHTGFKQGYGMTESCSCITGHPLDKLSYKYAHTGGSIVASTEVKIIKDDGTEANIGEPGEILARGPQVVMGYLNNEKATKETFDEDGWLHTGDQGKIDEEGMVTILDRIKEMIKVKGIQVAPAELEGLLLGHPKVEDCAVMGVSDDYAGEFPKAFVVVKPGVQESMETGKQLAEFVKDRKTRYKWVKEIEFVNEIPKSASGKILRRVLRDLERSGQSKGVRYRDRKEERMRL